MNQYNDPAAISLSEVFRGVLRRPLRIGLLTLLGLGAGLALVRMLPATYQTEARVLVERREAPLQSDGRSTTEAAQPIDERLISSQVAVIESTDFAAKSVKALKLDQNDGFSPATLTYGKIKSLAVSLGFSDDRRALSRERRAIDNLKDSVTVFSQAQSNVITIRAKMEDPKLAAQVANTLAEDYIRTTGVGGDENTKRIQQWLSTQIVELRTKVSASEGAVEKFRSEAGLLKGTNSTLGVQEISELNTQLTLAEAAQTEAEARAAEIKSQLVRSGSADSVTEVLNSPVIQALQEQRVTANRELTELSATYLSNHPKIRAAQSQITEIDKQVRKYALKIVAGLDSQAKVAASRADTIRASLDKLKAREGNANLEDVKLKALEREAAANRQLLETLLGRYVEVNTQKDLDVRPTLARIIQLAQVPSSVNFPRAGPTVLLTTLAGFGLGLGLAFLGAIMRLSSATVLPERSSTEFRSRLPDVYAPASQDYQPVADAPVREPPAPAFVPQAPVFTAPVFSPPVFTPPVFEPSAYVPVAVPGVADTADALPVVEKRIEFPIAAAPIASARSHASPIPSGGIISVGDEDDSLTTNLMTLAQTRAARHFAFTRVGCEPIDSAMAVFTCAKELCAIKKRVLVIDLDHERAELERLFGLPEGTGLLDLLAGQAEFNKLITRDAVSGAHVIRLGDVSNARQPEILALQIRAILRSIQGIYDFVLLHVGKASADCLPFLLTCDVAVIISPPSHDEDVLMAVETLTEKAAIQVLHVAVDRPVATQSPLHDAMAL
jgi:polysaccharide biosynthesis transport protein